MAFYQEVWPPMVDCRRFYGILCWWCNPGCPNSSYRRFLCRSCGQWSWGWYGYRHGAHVQVTLSCFTSQCADVHSAEMSPKEIRGQLGSLFQFFFTLGVMTSYWIDYAVEKHVEVSDRQWQIPIGLQLVPAGILGLGMLFLKESVRWLASKGRHEEALQSLIWVRGGEDTPEVRDEMAEILDGLSAEVAATEGVTWKELILPSNRYRLFIAITIQICMDCICSRLKLTAQAPNAPEILL